MSEKINKEGLGLRQLSNGRMYYLTDCGPYVAGEYPQGGIHVRAWELNANDGLGGWVHIDNAPSMVEAEQFLQTALRMTPAMLTIFSDEFSEQGRMFAYKVIWHPLESKDERHANFERCGSEGIIHFYASIHLQSIVHEVDHLIDWVHALGLINGMEERAHYSGFITECLVVSLLKKGFTWGPKLGSGVLWNEGEPVALLPAAIPAPLDVIT